MLRIRLIAGSLTKDIFADKSGTDSPTMAHTALRDIVERAVDEARKLPGLGGSGGTGRAPEERNIAERSYEDFLATAILNKVTILLVSRSEISRGHPLSRGLRSVRGIRGICSRIEREDKSMNERWIF